MTIDEVIKKQTEALKAEFMVTHSRAKELVLETVNEVLKSVKEEVFDHLDYLIKEAKEKR